MEMSREAICTDATYKSISLARTDGEFANRSQKHIINIYEKGFEVCLFFKGTINNVIQVLR